MTPISKLMMDKLDDGGGQVMLSIMAMIIVPMITTELMIVMRMARILMPHDNDNNNDQNILDLPYAYVTTK